MRVVVGDRPLMKRGGRSVEVGGGLKEKKKKVEIVKRNETTGC